MRKGFWGFLGMIFAIFIVLIALGYLSVTLGTPRMDVGKEIEKIIFTDSGQNFINNSNFSNATENTSSGMIK